MEDGNLYLRLRTMSHTIYDAKFEQMIFHQHVHLRGKNQSHIHLRRESQFGASVAIILCLHVLIARHIFLILDMLIFFSEYRCLKC